MKISSFLKIIHKHLQVLWEITAGALGQAPMAVTETPGGSVMTETEPIEEDGDLEEMKNRLQALKS